MNIWISLFFVLLAKITGPCRDSLIWVMDYLDGLAGSTTNRIDNAFAILVRAVLLGDYTTSETGGMEGILSKLITKVSPDLRIGLWGQLQKLKEVTLGTPGSGDDQAVEFLIEVLFPDGEPV